MQTVIGLFENANDAQRAVQELLNKGFSSDNVDVSTRDTGTGRDATNSDYSTNAGMNDRLDSSTDYASGSDYSTRNSDLRDDDTRISRDYTTDSDRGVGTSDTSDYRSRDRDNDDSFGDKVSNFFRNLFGTDDDDDTDRYVHVANNAGSIVTVHAQSNDEAERAADILDDYGAIDVNEKASEYGYAGRTNTNTFAENTSYSEDRDRNIGNDVRDRDSDDIADETLNVIREDVEISKREVPSGGIRLRSRIIERPVEEQLRLREDRIRVERNPVDRAATTADIQNFREGEIEMTEYAEVPEIRKEARVVEEVKLTKDVDERTETINTTAMDTEVDVENLSKDELRKRDKRKDS